MEVRRPVKGAITMVSLKDGDGLDKVVAVVMARSDGTMHIFQRMKAATFADEFHLSNGKKRAVTDDSNVLA